jgi:hypothetical protein
MRSNNDNKAENGRPPASSAINKLKGRSKSATVVKSKLHLTDAQRRMRTGQEEGAKGQKSEIGRHFQRLVDNHCRHRGRKRHAMARRNQIHLQRFTAKVGPRRKIADSERSEAIADQQRIGDSIPLRQEKKPPAQAKSGQDGQVDQQQETNLFRLQATEALPHLAQVNDS